MIVSKPWRGNWILWVFGVLCIASRAALAVDCDECDAKARLIAQQESLARGDQNLLDRNKAYLARLNPGDFSKSIKVKSNIVILALRLEAFQNNELSLKNEMAGKGCNACRKKTFPGR